MSRVTMLHASVLAPHPDNIRSEIGDVTETAASIMTHGLIQPLTVVPREDKAGHYYVIAGNRRLAAARKARLEQIPVIIRRDGLTPAQITEIMLVENCHRADLNPIDRARAMLKLRKAGQTIEQIASAIGMSPASVSQSLALLELDAATQARIRAGELSAAVGYQAVKGTRARQRSKAGHKPQGPVWEPDHFTGRHQLARKAEAMCEARGHTSRRKLGKIACGTCFETVIRADERLAVLVELGMEVHQDASGLALAR
jgi:ParB family transcriptional regulator, chromosome partitioning protein